MSEIIFNQERHIGIITLNRIEALNALTLEMIIALKQQLKAWAKDKDIHAVVIQSASAKAFCAGGDVRWLYEHRGQLHAQMSFFEEEYQLNQLISDYPKPYISFLSGMTIGGGVGISLHGSHPIASENFSFAMPETSIGFFPDIGASHLLNHCPSEIGTYLGLTGARLDCFTAYLCGLVHFVIPEAHFSKLLSELIVADLTDMPHQIVDKLIGRYQIPIKTAEYERLMLMIEPHFKHQDLKTILQSLEHAGLNKEAQQLMQKSPLALAVTLAQLHQAKGQALQACLEMDLTLASHFMQGHDFYEGVRALLVDKDKSPQWSPHCLSEVTEKMVRQYFVYND